MKIRSWIGLSVALIMAVFISPSLLAQEISTEQFLALFKTSDAWTGTWTGVQESPGKRRVQTITIARQNELGSHSSLVGTYIVTEYRSGQGARVSTKLVCTGTPQDKASPRTLELEEDLDWDAMYHGGRAARRCVTLKINGSQCYMDNHQVPCPKKTP